MLAQVRGSGRFSPAVPRRDRVLERRERSAPPDHRKDSTGAAEVSKKDDVDEEAKEGASTANGHLRVGATKVEDKTNKAKLRDDNDVENSDEENKGVVQVREKISNPIKGIKRGHSL